MKLHSPQKALKSRQILADRLSCARFTLFVADGFFKAFRLSASLSAAVFLLLALMLNGSALAQKNKRPQLLPISRNDFAGKVVLIPRDARVLELKGLGQIADHYLLLPPGRMLDPKPQPDQIIDWIKMQSFAGLTGAIISLESLAGESGAETVQRRLQTIRQIRQQNPKLQIYGFTSLDSSDAGSRLICQSALELVADGSMDYLLIGQKEDLSLKTAQIARARLIGEIAQRELTGQIFFDDDPDTAAVTLLARLFVHRFSWSPNILPIYSSNSGSASGESRDNAPLSQSIAAKIKLMGASALQQNAESVPGFDVLLCVHAPETSAEQRTAFAKNIQQIIDRGARVAVVDFSETRESKEALLAELRSHKLLGKLISYASSNPAGDPEEEPTREAANRALAQTVIFFAAMKSLRDNIDRVHRIDRAQSNLLFSRFLKDWAYDLIVHPQLDEFVKQQLKKNPDNLGNDADRAERFTFEALKPIADELFNEQFRRNTHNILINSGTRVQFRVSLLQRMQIRFPLNKTLQAEIRQMIHTFYEGSM